MSWLLPKGIVINSPEIEGSIERNNTEPLDLADIAKFWKGTAALGLPPALALELRDGSLTRPSLHHHQAAAPRSHGRAPGELLVAHMGQPAARAQRRDGREPVRDHLQRRQLRAAARAGQPR